MRKKASFLDLPIILVFLFSFFISAAQAPENTNPDVSETEVQQALNYLASDELAGRETGSEGIQKAAEFIEGKFNSFGVKPYFETYRDHFTVDGREGFNVVGFLEGSDPTLKDEIIIIGAHYDHIGKGPAVDGDIIANGANDNATGTVAVIELARHLAQIGENKRSIMFALFSAEEMGLKGSAHLAKKLKAEEADLYTVVNLEMIGVPMKDKDYDAYVTGFENSNLAQKFNEYSGGEQILGFLPQAKQYNLFKRSDNYPFYEVFKVPAQTISTFDFSNYPYYHHVDDEAEYLDAEHMASLIEKLIPGLYHMANTAEKEIKLTE